MRSRRRDRESTDRGAPPGPKGPSAPPRDPPAAEVGRNPEPTHARAKLVAAARCLFAEQGFHATTADQLIDAAGLTRGALYRDFADKRDLFRIVFEAVEQDLAATVIAAMQSDGSVSERRRAALRAFLRACLAAEVRRIVLLEGPVVLGWKEWREIDSQYSLGFVEGLVESEMQTGLRPRQPVRPLAHLIVGAVTEAGLAVASAHDPEAAIAEFMVAVEHLWGVRDPEEGTS